MFKLVRHQNTIRNALQCTQRQMVRNYSKAFNRPHIHHNGRAGIRKMATTNGEGSNDAALIAAGMGILGVTGYMVIFRYLIKCHFSFIRYFILRF